MADSAPWTEDQFGIICDRRALGHGKTLLSCSPSSKDAWARAACGITQPHAHLLVRRTASYTPWSDPIAGETAGTPERNTDV